MSNSNRYPPEREADLITATQTFLDVATPVPATYSLTAAQLTLLGTKLSDFQTKWDACQVPNTKTRPAVELKNASKADLVFYLRSLVKVVQNAPTTTNAMRAELAIPLRDFEPSPIPVPGAAPILTVKKVWGHQITCRLESAVSTGRAMPPGVYGAQIYSFVGPEPASDEQVWVNQGLVTRTQFVVQMAASVPAGAKVWLTAAFVNPRGQTGLACTPVMSGIGYEGAEPMAA
jgi:hypothetical protein